jgi:hypothetical protein
VKRSIDRLAPIGGALLSEAGRVRQRQLGAERRVEIADVSVIYNAVDDRFGVLIETPDERRPGYMQWTQVTIDGGDDPVMIDMIVAEAIRCWRLHNDEHYFFAQFAKAHRLKTKTGTHFKWIATEEDDLGGRSISAFFKE